MPSISRLNTNAKTKKRDKNDFYPTQYRFAKFHALQMVVGLTRKHYVLDVGVGEGIYGKAIREASFDVNVIGVEVNSDRFVHTPDYNTVYWNDFLECDFDGKRFDVIIGNPPYRYLEKFVKHGIELLNNDGILSFLVKASYLETETRYGFFKEHRPFSVYQSVLRPVSGHAESYVVVNYNKKPATETKLYWMYAKDENTYELI